MTPIQYSIFLLGLFSPGFESTRNGSDLYAGFEMRVDQYLIGTARRDGCAFNSELTRLILKEDDLFCPKAIFDQINHINEHKDGSDFSLHSLGWVLTHLWDNPLITQEMKYGIVEAVTNIPLSNAYPGDLSDMQYSSENHQIGWHAAEYIIGSAFANNPDLSSLVFPSSGENGQYHAEMGKYRVMRWLNFRLKYGFSEFNSDTYGPIAFRAVVALVGCASEQDVKDLANIVMNLQLYDHIIGSQGTKLATARGRAYTERKLDAGGYGLMYTVKGTGTEQEQDLGATQSVYFALAVVMGKYEMPEALLQVSQDVEEEDLVMEERFGLGEFENEVTVEDPENCTFWFGNGGYFSPIHPRCLFIVAEGYDLWDRSDVWGQLKIAKPIWDINPSLVDTVGEIGAPFGHGAVLGPANMRTFRSKGLMLSSVQDYKGGYMAGQQQAWQATLDHYRRGTVFSIQPRASNGTADHSSEYWVGGILPKIGQFGSTLISMYSPEVLNTAVFGLKITHAHFNHKEYDEFLLENNEDGSSWLIGRQNDLYVALYSWTGGEFVEEENGEERDFVSQGVQNVYICEVGNQAMNGTFEEFTTTVLSSQVQVDVFYNDSLLECLLDNNCLDTTESLIGCLLGECSATVDTSYTQELQTAVDSEDAVNMFKTLAERVNQIRKSDVSVSYTRGSTVFEFGWERPLTVDGSEIKTSDFMRYNNRFSLMDWGQRDIKIAAGEHELYMDFDTLKIIH